MNDSINPRQVKWYYCQKHRRAEPAYRFTSEGSVCEPGQQVPYPGDEASATPFLMRKGVQREQWLELEHRVATVEDMLERTKTARPPQIFPATAPPKTKPKLSKTPWVADHKASGDTGHGV